MFTTSEPTKSLRSWIERISNSDFSDIAFRCTEKETDFDSDSEYSYESDDLNFSEFNIKEVSTEDESISYKDGSKYLGNIEDRKPHGQGQLTLSNGKLLSGRFSHGDLCGVVTETDPQDGSVTERLYEAGLTCGTYRHRRLDGQLLAFGNSVQGVKVGPQLVIGSGGNSYFLGRVDDRDKLYGEVTFLYPCLRIVIACQYKAGKLVTGHYGTLASVSLSHKGGLPRLEFSSTIGREVFYDPPSCFSIGRHPLETDQYEDDSVYVAPSGVPGAGEGLFARRDIRGGELVSLFSGTKIYKENNKRSIKFGDEEWSDFRLTLDKSVDLDVGPEARSCSQYRATLGHKACHSFEMKNAAFREFEHPRFGRIMSVVAVRDIRRDEEVFVSYNYSVSHAPDWYQELWFRHCVTLGWTRQMISEWAEREVARWGVPINIPQFILDM